MSRLALSLLALLALNGAAVADCYSERRGAGSGHYALKEGVAHDSRTNLSWMRCSLGRHWAGTKCEGEPKTFTFDKALAAANDAGEGWRLPTIPELASLIDVSCGQPATDRVAFPDITPNDEGKASYWSVSPADLPNMRYIVDFAHGDVDAHSPGIWLNVRLVRSGR